MLVSVISSISSLFSTSVGVVVSSSSTKPNSGVTSCTAVVVITKDTDSCFAKVTSVRHTVKPFLVTVGLQRAWRSNQWLPRVTTQWGGAVITIGDQWVQGVGALGDDNEFCVMPDLHPETDLGEGCVPVGWLLQSLDLNWNVGCGKWEKY